MPQLLLVSIIWAFSFGLIKRHLGGVDSALVATNNARVRRVRRVDCGWRGPVFMREQERAKI